MGLEPTTDGSLHPAPKLHHLGISLPIFGSGARRPALLDDSPLLLSLKEGENKFLKIKI